MVSASSFTKDILKNWLSYTAVLICTCISIGAFIRASFKFAYALAHGIFNKFKLKSHKLQCKFINSVCYEFNSFEVCCIVETFDARSIYILVSLWLKQHICFSSNSSITNFIPLIESHFNAIEWDFDSFGI